MTLSRNRFRNLEFRRVGQNAFSHLSVMTLAQKAGSNSLIDHWPADGLRTFLVLSLDEIMVSGSKHLSREKSASLCQNSTVRDYSSSRTQRFSGPTTDSRLSIQPE